MNTQERVQQLRAQNKTNAEIKKELGINRNQLAGIIFRLTHPKPPPRPRQRAKAPAGKCHAEDRRRDERDLTILQMYTDGFSEREIAEHLQENGWPDVTKSVVGGLIDRDKSHFPDEPLRNGGRHGF